MLLFIFWSIPLPAQLIDKKKEKRELENYAFTNEGESAYNAKLSGRRSDAVLLMKDGKIVYERYDRGYHRTKKHRLWSIGKSFLNALIGMTVREKEISLEESICRYGIEKKCSIKVVDLLRWKSCLKWQETYERNPENSDVIRVLYGPESQDSVGYVLSRPFINRCGPDRHYAYSTGDSILLSGILKNIHGKDYDAMVWESFFGRLGMHHITVEQDGKGVYLFGTHVYATARDVASFGSLYLRKKQDFFPTNWTTFSGTLATGEENFGPRDIVPTAHFWGNQMGHLSTAPRDSLIARGHWGQFLVIIPSLNIIIVRFGDTRDDSFSLDTFVALALEYLK